MTQQATADSQPFEVAFVPTIDDQVRVLRATIRRRRRPWAPVVFVAVVLVALVNGFRRDGAAALSGDTGIALLVVAVGIAAWLGGPAFARWAFARRAQREPGLLAPVSYRFAPEGVRVRMGGGVTRLSWNDVAGVRETRELFYFEIGRDTSLYVPRRVLDGAGEARLRSLLKARLGARARVS
jgi:hypothetical protein